MLIPSSASHSGSWTRRASGETRPDQAPRVDQGRAPAGRVRQAFEAAYIFGAVRPPPMALAVSPAAFKRFTLNRLKRLLLLGQTVPFGDGLAPLQGRQT